MEIGKGSKLLLFLSTPCQLLRGIWLDMLRQKMYSDMRNEQACSERKEASNIYLVFRGSFLFIDFNYCLADNGEEVVQIFPNRISWFFFRGKPLSSSRSYNCKDCCYLNIHYSPGHYSSLMQIDRTLFLFEIQ